MVAAFILLFILLTLSSAAYFVLTCLGYDASNSPLVRNLNEASLESLGEVIFDVVWELLVGAFWLVIGIVTALF